MRHHLYHPDFKFVVEPESFNKYSEREFLQYCLGATMYMPGFKDFTPKILSNAMPGLTSIVLCCEDACPEDRVQEAEENIYRLLHTVTAAVEDGTLDADKVPLIFVRIRDLEQFKRFGAGLTKQQVKSLCGINFPKFNAENGYEYYAYLADLNERFGEIIYGMPIIEDPEVAYKETMAILQQKYMDGELSARQYQNAIELAELEHLRKVANLYQDGSKERLKAEKHYHDTSLKYQQKHLQEARQAQEKMRQTYFTKGFRVTDDESYQRDMQNLELVYKQMLKAAGDSKRDRLRVERAFYEAKYQLARKYNKKEAKELKNSFRGAIDDSIAWLESDAGKAMTESFSTIVNQMGAIFSGLSEIIQAELDIQTAQIERKYDREISYAEGNKSQEVALEQQKQAEIGKAKQEANRKMFAMQVMQAVAQTAMSAIAAYSSAAAIPIVGFVMAPIAAAMAVAAGAIQIAAIKKQQEASEAQGYMEGGFTKPGRKDEPAGIVHAGEWVASQDLLRNPQARAMIETLDYAQRTNTVGRLSASDVSQSITAPQRIAQASSNGELLAVAAASQALSRSVNEMNGRLHEPFVTVNTVTGDTGIRKAQDEYEQLMRNKTPKSRR